MAQARELMPCMLTGPCGGGTAGLPRRRPKPRNVLLMMAPPPVARKPVPAARVVPVTAATLPPVSEIAPAPILPIDPIGVTDPIIVEPIAGSKDPVLKAQAEALRAQLHQMRQDRAKLVKMRDTARAAHQTKKVQRIRTRLQALKKQMAETLAKLKAIRAQVQATLSGYDDGAGLGFFPGFTDILAKGANLGLEKLFGKSSGGGNSAEMAISQVQAKAAADELKAVTAERKKYEELNKQVHTAARQREQQLLKVLKQFAKKTGQNAAGILSHPATIAVGAGLGVVLLVKALSRKR